MSGNFSGTLQRGVVWSSTNQLVNVGDAVLVVIFLIVIFARLQEKLEVLIYICEAGHYLVPTANSESLGSLRKSDYRIRTYTSALHI